MAHRFPPSAGRRPAVECLEDRLVPAKIFVHATADGPSAAFSGNVAPNLRSAIDFSHAGDEIELDSKTYMLTGAEGGQLLIDHDLTVRNNQGGVSTIDAQNQSRVFEIAGGEGIVAVMSGLTITHGNGSGAAQGGGVEVDGDATLTMNSCRVTGNSASGGDPGRGGGIANFGTLTLNQCVVSQNLASGLSEADAEGGGVFQGTEAGLLTIRNSTLSGNTARGGDGGNGEGGGLFDAGGAGNVAISGSTFAGNHAFGGSATSGGDVGDAFGGGLYQEANSGQLRVVNSTFGGNTAVGGLNGNGGLNHQPGNGGGNATGGGLYLGDGNTDTLINDTIARNVASAGVAGGTAEGGGLATGTIGRNVPHPQVWNTLIALNGATTGRDAFGTFVSLGHNLLGSAGGATGFSAARGDLLNVAAAQIGLGPLANNGGPTQTMALAPTSIAVDHGDDAVLRQLTTDQRGLPRKSGAHVDIGAYEFQVPVPVRRGRRNGPLH